MRRLTILGSTGSIGCTALDIVRHLRGRSGEVKVEGLSAHGNISRLIEQVREFRPAAVAELHVKSTGRCTSDESRDLSSTRCAVRPEPTSAESTITSYVICDTSRS